MNNRIKTAFTLIELLVVIAIIGILSGLIIVGMSSSVQQATLAKAQVFSASLRDSMLTSLVSEWKLDGSGIANGSNATTAYTQDTWSSNNCTINGTPLAYSGSNCMYGSCLKFNGTSDWLNCGAGSNLNITDGITLEAWAKWTTWTLNTYHGIVYKANSVEGAGGCSTNYALASNWWNFRPDFFITTVGGPSCQHFNGATTLSLNTWYHLVGTYDSSTGSGKLYLNGKIDNSTTLSGKIPITPNSLQIGRGNNYFPGYIDNVRIYNTAMPTSLVRERYHTGIINLLVTGLITNDEYKQRLLGATNNLGYE